jgi:hypothetical protein
MTDPKHKIGLDELQGIITEIVRHGDGADRFRAIKMLKELVQETGTSGLPEPMSDDEKYDRMARLMKAMGHRGCSMSYRRAFPHANTPLHKTIPKLLPDDLHQLKKKPMSLKHLYRLYPETKRSGIPPGYPVNGGMEAQIRWVQKKADEIELRRLQEGFENGAAQDITGEEAKSE